MHLMTAVIRTVLGLFLAACSAAAAQEPLPLSNPGARSAVDLGGPWRYIIDKQRVGIKEPIDRFDFSRDEPDHNHPLIEYAWDTSPEFRVPSDWNSQIRELAWYEDMVWFRRTLQADPKPDRRYFLYFEAVNYRARVYLNGEKLGEHAGGFTPFAFEVTSKLAHGRNSLVVSADARHETTSVPNEVYDWRNYGGITRPVYLIDVPETFIHDSRIRLLGDGTIEAVVRLEGPNEAGADVELRIAELKMTARGRTDPQGRVTLRARPRGLVRWSPQTPRLYDVELRAGGDRLGERIGFRTVEARGGRILLNNSPVTLNGISVHEEALGDNATRTLTWDSARALLMQAKALGANFVRLAHYPHSEKMTRLADELGLMVWSEIPVYWDMDFANPAVLEHSRHMLSEMIARDANRASVVIWSVSNETQVSDARNAFQRALIAHARASDSTRLIAAAIDARRERTTADGSGALVSVDDPIGADLDVIGFNLYVGWYGTRTPDEIDNVQWTSSFAKPLILSEFGADALYGNHGDRLQRWTEEYQAYFYEGYLRMTSRIPNYAGTSPWILKDFRSPRRFHGRYQDYWNRKGIVDPSGRRKLAFDVLRRHYEGKGKRPGETRLSQ
jgi:beta-glucuronidase